MSVLRSRLRGEQVRKFAGEVFLDSGSGGFTDMREGRSYG
jgi:hypothetical protein